MSEWSRGKSDLDVDDLDVDSFELDSGGSERVCSRRLSDPRMPTPPIMGRESRSRQFSSSEWRCGNTPGWVVRGAARSRVSSENNPRVPSSSQDGFKL